MRFATLNLRGGGENNDAYVGDGSSESSSSKSVETSTENSGFATNRSTSSFSLAKEETRVVFRIKILVLIVIGVAALTCGIWTYVFVTSSEHELFRQKFLDYAAEISALSHQEAADMVNSIQALGVLISSMAVATESSFPNITIPDFEFHGSNCIDISKVLQVSFAPLVSEKYRPFWEAYSVAHHDWPKSTVDSGLGQLITDQLVNVSDGLIPPRIHPSANESQMKGKSKIEDDVFETWVYAPVWQQVPAPSDLSVINFDLLSHSVLARVFRQMSTIRKPVLSESFDMSFLSSGAVTDVLMVPISQSLVADEESDSVGVLVAVVAWDVYFVDILHGGSNGIIVVLDGPNDDHFTYKINGPEAIFLGTGDLHDSRYNDIEVSTPFAPFLADGQGLYILRMFPSWEMEQQYRTRKPFLFAAIVVLVFGCTAMVFLLFDYAVAIRQRKMITKAKRTHTIVSSLFPANVRDRMLQDADNNMQRKRELDDEKECAISNNSHVNQIFRRKSSDNIEMYDTKPIADLFPDATVMFADIVGFTAWSSTREPTHVFTLLETLYHAFDLLAHRRRVFKVETIGDCYVAVAGLPELRSDHAVVMARFARDLLDKMGSLTSQLETTLGPDTSDLSIRIGLHSGPVTAGVLRGEKGRFQLFGDTVNTAARMESTGQRQRIHCSQETADLLVTAGKSWTTARDEIVDAKGKGGMQTYWIEAIKTSTSSVRSRSESDDFSFDNGRKSMHKGNKLSSSTHDEKIGRLVDWNTDVFCGLVKQVLAYQDAFCKKTSQSRTQAHDLELNLSRTVVDEVVEIIELPQVMNKARTTNSNEDELEPAVVEQIRKYILAVALMYNDNPFHNFEHASHVILCVTKLMSRIVAPDGPFDACIDNAAGDRMLSLHDHTYGITSNPLTHFACVFAALIQDVDHSGVPNAQLVKENHELAVAYKGKCVAEQNSMNLAWELFMKPEYSDFRKALLHNDISNMKRFRQLVVNSVMATDIWDKDLRVMRDTRWSKAFHSDAAAVAIADGTASEDKCDDVNRKATIVLEHVIQASDFSHTMQHWHIYRKWNERFFHESIVAFRNGRAGDQHPANSWYQREIDFFDCTIIPLTKKLKECGVFGVSSDEYLNYAEKNRAEWVFRGHEIVSEMTKKYDDILIASSSTTCTKDLVGLTVATLPFPIEL